MISYVETRQQQKKLYEVVVYDDNGKIISKRQVEYPLYIRERDGETYFLLYNDDMKLIDDAYFYLNHYMRQNPMTTRKKNAYALRYLYCFLDLSGSDIQNINITELKELIKFLRGLTSSPEKPDNNTYRTSSTINEYLSVFRNYFRALNIESEALFDSKSITIKNEANAISTTQTRTKYINNVRMPGYSGVQIPMYISPEEFQRLYSIVIKKNDVQTAILMHIMYGYGLRLGEVLGLTIEDLQEITENGVLYPVLVLRNRKSDQTYQYAKNLPHIDDIRKYHGSDYQKTRCKVIISYELYEDILRFIEESHTRLMKSYPENYKNSSADIVSVKDIPDSNHYIFLNRYGRTLSDQTWNNTLKGYFKDAGIALDENNKKSNLSHRFRHGFAMFHAHYSPHPVDALKLQHMMRHKSISSTMIYYTPTFEDQFNIKTEFLNEMYNLVPELKTGVNYLLDNQEENTDGN